MWASLPSTDSCLSQPQTQMSGIQSIGRGVDEARGARVGRTRRRLRARSGRSAGARGSAQEEGTHLLSVHELCARRLSAVGEPQEERGRVGRGRRRRASRGRAAVGERGEAVEVRDLVRLDGAASGSVLWSDGGDRGKPRVDGDEAVEGRRRCSLPHLATRAGQDRLGCTG